jgi:diguanylate cyclase (GGDEF)-like protein
VVAAERRRTSRGTGLAGVLGRAERGSVGGYAAAAPQAGAAFLLSSAGLIYLSLLVPGYIRPDWTVPFALSGVPCVVAGALLLRRRQLVEVELVALTLYGDAAIVLSGYASLDRNGTTAGALLGLPTLFVATFMRPRWLLRQSAVAAGCAWTINVLVPAGPAVHLVRTAVLLVACLCPALIVLLLRRQLERAVLTDPLTGLANRRGLEARYGDQVARARRDRLPLCLLLADVDHFKQVNDRFGHHVGDRVLREVADTVVDAVRSVDVVVRLGGEEIAVVLVADEAQLGQVAERIRSEVERATAQPGVTVSIGGSWCRPHLGVEAGLEALVQQADVRMYQAKRSGRNQVVLPVPTP